MDAMRSDRRWFAVGVGVVAALVVLLLLTACGPAAPEVEFEAQAVRERICIRCGTADNEVRNGYDLIFYSDNGSTETATISGDSGNASFDGTLNVQGGAITGENDETLDNGTDTAWVIGGFIAADVAVTLDITGGDIITPTGTYQAITNAFTASVTTDATTAIADGPVEGALLILVNEDAYDIVVKDGANTLLSGDLTLTGGAMDTLTLIWNGADWVGVSFIDN